MESQIQSFFNEKRYKDETFWPRFNVQCTAKLESITNVIWIEEWINLDASVINILSGLGVMNKIMSVRYKLKKDFWPICDDGKRQYSPDKQEFHIKFKKERLIYYKFIEPSSFEKQFINEFWSIASRL